MWPSADGKPNDQWGHNKLTHEVQTAAMALIASLLNRPHYVGQAQLNIKIGRVSPITIWRSITRSHPYSRPASEQRAQDQVGVSWIDDGPYKPSHHHIDQQSIVFA